MDLSWLNINKIIIVWTLRQLKSAAKFNMWVSLFNYSYDIIYMTPMNLSSSK